MPRNVKSLNALTRAVGVYPNVEVETLELDVLPGDIFLLCSDGLHNYMKNFDLLTFLDHVEVQDAVTELINYANKRGGKDNITAIVLRATDRNETVETMRIRLTISTLREIPLFQFLSFGELLRVINVCKSIEMDAGSDLITEGTPGNDFYILLEGQVRVHRNGQEMVRLGPGRHFGEMALIDNNPRSASVTTTTKSTCIHITRDDFYALMREDSVLAVKLLWNFIQTLSMMVRRANAEHDAPELDEEDLEIESPYP